MKWYKQDRNGDRTKTAAYPFWKQLSPDKDEKLKA